MSEALVTVMGNVVRHVEIRNTNSGAKVSKFSVASARSWKGESGWEQTETSYFDVECWGKLAENVNNSLWKGQSVIVHGHVRTDRWESEDGEKHQRQKIVAKAVGPNLRHHQAQVKTMTEKQHEAPTGKTFAVTAEVDDADGKETVRLVRAEEVAAEAGISGSRGETTSAVGEEAAGKYDEERSKLAVVGAPF